MNAETWVTVIAALTALFVIVVLLLLAYIAGMHSALRDISIQR